MNMKYLKFTIVITLIIVVRLCVSQRRVINGFKTKYDQPYMVYLLKSASSHAYYRGWMCGGSIIHPIYVLTSATCIKDTYNVYVISGLREYISEKRMEEHPCTQRMKKRVISMCEFKREEYNITNYYTYNISSDNGFDDATAWAFGNIGLARVESPFEFYNENYKLFCHYQPRIISVNFVRKYEAPGTQAVAFGWGNTRFYRPVGDRKIYNEEILHYTATVVMDAQKCLDVYQRTNAKDIPHKYSILCTFDSGVLTDSGLPRHLKDFCLDCEDTTSIIEPLRRWMRTTPVTERTTVRDWMEVFGHGICQNDQGGPLVSWIGGRQTVIGVASAFLVTEKMECKGPFLFTSTACISRLIQCILTSKLRRSATDCYNIRSETGHKIVETHIEWHEDNQYPKLNEKVMRMPLNVSQPNKEAEEAASQMKNDSSVSNDDYDFDDSQYKNIDQEYEALINETHDNDDYLYNDYGLNTSENNAKFTNYDSDSDVPDLRRAMGAPRDSKNEKQVSDNSDPPEVKDVKDTSHNVSNEKQEHTSAMSDYDNSTFHQPNVTEEIFHNNSNETEHIPSTSKPKDNTDNLRETEVKEQVTNNIRNDNQEHTLTTSKPNYTYDKGDISELEGKKETPQNV